MVLQSPRSAFKRTSQQTSTTSRLNTASFISDIRPFLSAKSATHVAVRSSLLPAVPVCRSAYTMHLLPPLWKTVRTFVLVSDSRSRSVARFPSRFTTHSKVRSARHPTQAPLSDVLRNFLELSPSLVYVTRRLNALRHLTLGRRSTQFRPSGYRVVVLMRLTSMKVEVLTSISNFGELHHSSSPTQEVQMPLVGRRARS